jgi:hypothetical protein
MTLIDWLWNNRTKVLGYTGQLLTQLGTSGIIESPKVISWCAFAAFACVSLVGHLNDYQARRAQETT